MYSLKTYLFLNNAKKPYTLGLIGAGTGAGAGLAGTVVVGLVGTGFGLVGGSFPATFNSSAEAETACTPSNALKLVSPAKATEPPINAVINAAVINKFFIKYSYNAVKIDLGI